MTDRAFHTTRRGAVHSCDRRIQLLRHCAEQIHIGDDQRNGIANVLIAFDMCRNADLMDQVRNIHFQIIGCQRILQYQRFAQMALRGIMNKIFLFMVLQLIDPFDQHAHIDRLDKIILRAQMHGLLDHRILSDCRGHNHTRIFGQLKIIQSF